MLSRFRYWPWLTLQIIAANVLVIALLAMAWYVTFMRQSSVYSERLMSTFNIEPGSLHAMYVDDVERQLWLSVVLGLVFAILAAVVLALIIVRPLRSLAAGTQRLRQGDYRARSSSGSGEVGRLSDNFNALAAALEQEEQRRAQFMKDLGHEFRTPIMSLQGYTEGLEDGVFEADEGYFNLMAAELSHLTMLTHTIESMQLYSPEVHGVSDDSSVTAGLLLEEAVARWHTRFAQRDLALVLANAGGHENTRLKISPGAFKQITDNLLSNMYRYASVGTRCTIDISGDIRHGLIKLNFSNEAPDIEAQHLPFLFDRFYRVSDSRTRVMNEHPSGLGLSVVKQLCLVNQGSVSAGLSGQALVICVELPARQD